MEGNIYPTSRLNMGNKTPPDTKHQGIYIEIEKFHSHILTPFLPETIFFCQETEAQNIFQDIVETETVRRQLKFLKLKLSYEVLSILDMALKSNTVDDAGGIE